MPDGGSCQMAGDFPKVCVHDLFDRCFGFRFFGQNDLSDDGIHIGVRKLYSDGEAALKLL